EMRATRVPAMLMADTAAAGAGRGVPGGIELPVRTYHGVGVVLLLGAGIVGSGRPDAECDAWRRVRRIHGMVGRARAGHGETEHGEDVGEIIRAQSSAPRCMRSHVRNSGSGWRRAMQKSRRPATCRTA